MHDKIDDVEIYLEVCEILERYEISKSVKFIYENKNVEEIGKELLSSMADYTKR